LEKPARFQRAPRGAIHLAAGHQRALQRRAPQVEVAVVKPLLFGGVDLVLDEERRRLTAIEDGGLGGVDLDLAGLQLGVDVRALPRGRGSTTWPPACTPLAAMKRLFLSAPTTCALLLGAGLLLRANAALRTEASPSGDPSVRVLKEGPKASPMDVTPHLGRG